MANAAQGIAQYLGETIAGLTYSETDGSGNVFVDRMPSAPDQCVAVFNTGGGAADSKLPYDSPDVMVLLRSSDGTSAWAVARWGEIYSALHGLRNMLLPNGVFVVWALGAASSPNRTGADANGRPSYSGVYRLEILNPTSARESL